MAVTVSAEARRGLKDRLEAIRKAVDDAGALGIDRAQEIWLAERVQKDILRRAEELGLAEVTKVLSDPNNPNLVLAGVDRLGKRVVLKATTESYKGPLAILNAWKYAGAPAVPVLRSVRSVGVSYDVLPMIGEGGTLRDDLGAVGQETNLHNTKRLIDLARSLRLEGSVPGVTMSLDQQLKGAFEESHMKLVESKFRVQHSASDAANTYFTGDLYPCHGDLVAGNSIVDPETGVLVAIDPRAVLAPRETDTAGAIAQSQLIGDDLRAAIVYALKQDSDLDRARLELAIGMYQTMFAGYAVVNKQLHEAHPDRYPQPIRTSHELFESGQALIAGSIGPVLSAARSRDSVGVQALTWSSSAL